MLLVWPFQEIVWVWMFVFLDNSLKNLASFWTGMDVLPLSEKLVMRFATDERSMPFSNTCFNTLPLPVIYSDYNQFKDKMDVALKYGYKGFDAL